MSRMMVSFPHQWTPEQQQSLLHLGDEETKWVDLYDFEAECPAAAYGLAVDEEHILAGVNQKLFVGDRFRQVGGHLAIISAETGKLEDIVDLQIRDVHSVAVDNGNVYLVSSEQNAVLAVDKDKLGTEKPEIVYRAHPAEVDMVHLNSLSAKNGEILVSGFGLREGERWHTARNGFIADVQTGEVLQENIYHPHSVTMAGNGEVLVCESSKGRLHNVSTGEVIFETPNYLRGIACPDDNTLLIGQSKGRYNSALPNVIFNAADPGELVGFAGIYEYDLHERSTRLVQDLRTFGPEIYDILLLPE